MKFKKFVFVLVWLFCFVNLHAQTSKHSRSQCVKEKLSVTIDDLGKKPPSMNYRITGIESKYLTSVLHVHLNGSKEITPVIINDKTFNYEYFNDEIYANMKNRKAKIDVLRYKIQGRTVYVATKIE